MKTAALEVKEKPLAAAESRSENRSLTFAERTSSYIVLIKPRIALMLVLTAAAGFYLGTTRNFNWILFANAMIGIALLAFGVATLNQFLERETDKLMRRTETRPLPSGKLANSQALIFGILLCATAEIYLWILVNPLTAILGFAVIVGYVLLYTPLKTRTTLSTVIGAFPGAMPPLMGWTSAANEITIPAWVLFTILFFWQFPHFLAIAWLYREEYKKAGILMLPVVESSGRLTAQQIVVFTLLLVPISFAPFFINLSGWVFLAGASILGFWFIVESIKFAREKSDAQARKLLRVSIIYLPLLFLLAVINRI
jgi:protoheme IX farnesyltransferase